MGLMYIFYILKEIINVYFLYIKRNNNKKLMNINSFTLDGKKFNNRMLIGTANYPSFSILEETIKKSKAEIVTVSLRRQTAQNKDFGDKFFEMIKKFNLSILPNTANCKSVKEIVSTAHMARELFQTNWIKLETIGNEYTLQPEIFLLVEAAKILCEEGFEVFPYTTEDLVVAEKLLNAGCKILMPWGSPIGSGRGLMNKYLLQQLLNKFKNEATFIIDAGIGKPSQAMEAMEMGFDAVLLNTAISQAFDPISMSEAFSMAINYGYIAQQSGLMNERDFAQNSTPNIGMPFWHNNAD
jgi:thiazole synthase